MMIFFWVGHYKYLKVVYPDILTHHMLMMKNEYSNYVLYICMYEEGVVRLKSVTKDKNVKGTDNSIIPIQKERFHWMYYYTFFDHVAILELTQVLIWLYQSQAKSIQLQSFLLEDSRMELGPIEPRYLQLILSQLETFHKYS